MQEVPEFAGKKDVWHMHPIVFLWYLNIGSPNHVECSFCQNGINISPELLVHCYGITAEKANIYSLILTRCFVKYSINNCLRISHFLGQVGVETAMLRDLKEGFYYRDGDRLWNIYKSQLKKGLGKKFPNYTDLQKKQYTKDHLVCNEDALTRVLFPSQYEGMDYRGRGLIHLTHEENYAAYKVYSEHDVVTNPKLLESDIELAVDSACWYWSVFAKLNADADKDDLTSLTYKINKAGLKMEQRGALKNKALAFIKSKTKGCKK